MKGFGGAGGMSQLLKQANQMQSRIKKVQDELALKQYEGTSGGGAVKIIINGDYLVQSVQIDAEIMKSSDLELLQDMIRAATNDAVKTAKDTHAQEMQKVTGGVGIPGLF